MALNSACIGDPASHRRVVGPLAARRLDALTDDLAGDGAWRSLDALAGEPDHSCDQLLLVGALCDVDDVDAGVSTLRRVLAPGAQLRFLEHTGRPGALGALQRLADPVFAAVPLGCHVRHDVAAAIRRGGFLVDELERFTLPSAVPLLRHWVQGVARSPA